MPRYVTAPEVIQLLDEANVKSSIGRIEITFNGLPVKLRQRDTVGNALQEWLCAFLKSKDVYYRPNIGQTFPDFYFSEANDENLCEMKSFISSANFDVANYRSYVNSIAEKPYRLNSDYIIFKYDMNDEGDITILDYWCKKVWEITGPTADYALKCQRKRGQIVNIRPSTWYSDRASYPPFGSLEKLLKALYQTQLSVENSTKVVNEWLQKVLDGYNAYFGTTITAQDIKNA
jgi:type II restriction enzyme